MRERVVIALRAHFVDEDLIRRFNRLKQMSCHDVVILLHNEKGAEYGTQDVVSFSSETVEKLDLTTFGRTDWAWHMGDYALYQLFNDRPQYDSLMVEYDVKINFSIDDLTRTVHGAYDYVALYSGPSNASWCWHHAATLWFKQPHVSFFPLVMTSRQLAESAADKRRELGRAWATSGRNDSTVLDFMVHCEAFMPSACAEFGFSLADIANLLPSWDSRYFATHGVCPWDIDVMGHVAAIHPSLMAKDLPNYMTRNMSSTYVPQAEKDRMMEQLHSLLALGVLDQDLETELRTAWFPQLAT